MSSPAEQMWRRRRRAAPLAIVACLALTAAIVGTGRRQTRAGSAASDYSVLRASGPSGLTPIKRSAEARAAGGPVVDAEDPQVEIASAREAHVTVRGMRVWVAKSREGGICVLALKPEPAHKGAVGPASGCAPVDRAGHGASLEMFGPAGETFVAGAVPDGVTTVSVTLESGASKSVAVSDNAYGLESASPVSIVAFTADDIRQEVNLGGSR